MSADFDQQMAQFAERFITRTTEDRATLTAALDDLPRDPQSARLRIRDVAHRLAGIAAMFGFDNIGALAAQTDDASRDAGVADTSLAALGHQLVAMLEELASQRN